MDKHVYKESNHITHCPIRESRVANVSGPWHLQFRADEVVQRDNRVFALLPVNQNGIITTANAH